MKLIVLCILMSSSAMANPSVPATPAAPQAAVPAMTPAATPPQPIAEADKKKLLSEFQKAQTNERSAYSHQERAANKELNAAQGMKLKKWREEQKNARKVFFDQHTSGPERRAYVQNYLKIKDAFEQSLKSDTAAAKKMWADKIAAMKASQKDNEAKFKDSLNRNERPAAELWPSNH